VSWWFIEQTRGHPTGGCNYETRIDLSLDQELELDVISLQASDLLLILGVDIGQDRVETL
jgi:hypothetical protein